MLSELKKEQTDRQKVNAWLDKIGSADEKERNEVLELCARDKEARAYYVGRYEEECK